MADPISRADVEHVAKLSRLALTNDEIEHITSELAGILGHVRDMEALDLSEVPPTATLCRSRTCFVPTRSGRVWIAMKCWRWRPRPRMAGSGYRGSWGRHRDRFRIRRSSASAHWLVDTFSRRLQVQERLTVQIAETLKQKLNANGVAVVMEARHLCMMMRGVEKQNTLAVTSSMLEVFRNQLQTREEFLKLINHS